MSEKLINKMRKKFVFIAMLSFILVMTGMGAIIYTTNLMITRQRISRTLDAIIQFEGYLPAQNADSISTSDADAAGTPDTDSESSELPTSGFWNFPSLYEVFSTDWRTNPESHYATRYFSVIFAADGSVTNIITSHIASIDEDTAQLYGEAALKSSAKFNNFGDYYYKVGELENGSTIVVYLDSRDQIITNNRLLYTALGLIALGILITFILVRHFSFLLVEQEIRNAETQKQFITNASHELKTPLAVIRANTEVETMLNGESEWSKSTLKQIDRMNGLIQNLVMISRAQEREDKTAMTLQDISVIVKDTVDTFTPVAEQDGKEIQTNLQEQSNLLCEESEIRQLTSLLLDNAIKYCDENGVITVTVTGRKRGGNAKIVVSNSYAAGASVDYSKFFQRFYREDESHHSESTKSGYGIGLSIVEALVQKYHGDVNASWNDGIISFTCLLKY